MIKAALLLLLLATTTIAADPATRAAATLPVTLAPDKQPFRLPSQPEMVNLNAGALLFPGPAVFQAGGNLDHPDDKTYTGRFSLAVRDVKSGKKLHAVSGDGYPIFNAAVTPDGSRAVFSMINWSEQGHHIVMWTDLADNSEAHELFRGISWSGAIAIAPDGKLAASADLHSGGGQPATQLQLWSLPEGDLVHDIEMPSPVGALTFDAVNHLLIGGGRDGRVFLWPIEAGEVRTLSGNTNTINAVAVSLDGALVAAGDQDGAILLWKISTGEFLHRLEDGTRPIRTLAFSADGRLLVSGVNAESNTPAPDWFPLRVWDVASGRELAKCSPPPQAINISDARFSEDAKQLWGYFNWVGAVYEMPAIDLAHLPPAATQPAQEPNDGQAAVLPIEGYVSTLVIDAQNNMIVAGASGGVLAWNADTYQANDKLQMAGVVRIVQPENDLAICTEESNEEEVITVRRLSNGESLHEFRGGLPYADAIAVSADGKRLAAACGTRDDRTSPKFNPEVHLWNLETGEEVWKQTDDIAKSIRDIAFARDGETLLCGWSGDGKSGVRQLSSANGEVVKTFDAPKDARGTMLRVLASADVVFAVPSGGQLLRWNLKTGEALPSISLQGQVMSAALSADGSRLAIGDANTNILLFDCATAKLLRRMRPHDGAVTAVEFFPDGKKLVSSASDKTVRVWNLP